MSPISHAIGFDDGPFPRTHRGNVLLIGAVFSRNRLEGVLSAAVRRDGANSTAVIARTVAASRFAGHTQLILLQGIAFAGFNVVDIHALSRSLDIAVAVVVRRQPDMDAIRRALLTRVKGGARKWRLVRKAGALEPVAGVFVQRVGVSLQSLGRYIADTAVNGVLPEPLRTAHLIAGGVAGGESRHRP